MAEGELAAPIPRAAEVPSSMFQATLQWERVALKWRNLAVQRRDHHFELYRSGRWKHYYTDAEFIVCLREATVAANRWVQIAPRPEDFGQAAE